MQIPYPRITSSGCAQDHRETLAWPIFDHPEAICSFSVIAFHVQTGADLFSHLQSFYFSLFFVLKANIEITTNILYLSDLGGQTTPRPTEESKPSKTDSDDTNKPHKKGRMSLTPGGHSNIEEGLKHKSSASGRTSLLPYGYSCYWYRSYTAQCSPPLYCWISAASRVYYNTDQKGN